MNKYKLNEIKKKNFYVNYNNEDNNELDNKTVTDNVSNNDLSKHQPNEEKQQNTLLLGNGPLDTIYEKYTDHSIKSTSESKLSTPSATNQSRIQEESKLGPRPTSIPPRCPPTRGPPRRGPPRRGPPGRGPPGRGPPGRGPPGRGPPRRGPPGRGPPGRGPPLQYPQYDTNNDHSRDHSTSSNIEAHFDSE